MNRYKSKPAEIEAYQWFPEEMGESPGVSYETNMTEAGIEIRSAYVTTTNGNKAYICPGDYVIREPDGNGYYPCKADIFDKRWERIYG